MPYLTITAAWCISNLTLAMNTELTAFWAKSAYDHGGLGWKEEYKIGILYALASLTLLSFLILLFED